MRAVQFTQFGLPEQLHLVDLPNPQLNSGTAVICVVAASVNPSDVKNVAGQMEHTTLPRVPGRDFSGVVEQGPAAP
jgi:NADPH2:quinone reductase